MFQYSIWCIDTGQYLLQDKLMLLIDSYTHNWKKKDKNLHTHVLKRGVNNILQQKKEFFYILADPLLPL